MDGEHIFKNNKNQIQCPPLNVITVIGTDLFPVSYTHLDVYKRQVCYHSNK